MHNADEAARRFNKKAHGAAVSVFGACSKNMVQMWWRVTDLLPGRYNLAAQVGLAQTCVQTCV